MANINLLPWREELREERKKSFVLSMGLVVVMAGLLLFLIDRLENNKISNQQSRNAYLTDQIAELDLKLIEIRELREQKALLTTRMAVIQDLQGSRPLIVRLFDELAHSLPENVYYDNISRTNDQLMLVGVAESNAKVSELMRNLDRSEWLSNATLNQINAVPTQSSTDEAERISFELSVLAINTSLAEQEQE